MQVFCMKDFEFLENIVPYMPGFGSPVTILDAGANIGLASTLFAELTGLHGQVLAVEAVPHTADMAADNTRHLGGIVTLIRGALVSETHASESGMLRMSLPGTQYWAARLDTVSDKASSATSQLVPAITLAALQVCDALLLSCESSRQPSESAFHLCCSRSSVTWHAATCQRHRSMLSEAAAANCT